MSTQDELETVAKAAYATLDMIDEAAAKSAGGYDELKARADEVYQSRVTQLAKRHGVPEIDAHGLAMKDDVASRAYELSTGLAEKQELALRTGDLLPAYLG